jgi:hypothetical protein
VKRLLAVSAVLALTVGSAPLASADGSGNPITGTGSTASAVTMSWAQGLVRADNQTVATPRDPNSPLSFLYPDFQNLKVTVSQTQGLVHQALNVSWTGMSTAANGGFLQLMQCYGDADTGPSPENCEFGTPANLLPSGLVNTSAGSRTGAVCVANSAPSTKTPPSGADGGGPAEGCDTAEPTNATHIDPQAEGPGTFDIPFVPAGTDQKVYQAQLGSQFDQLNTNEVQSATSDSDGSGQDFFQVLTATEAPGLSCGQLESGGATRNCWLVIVPRGQFDANGFQLHGNSPLVGNPAGSPLSASLWAQRIQIHLGFAPIAANCAIGSAQEREMIGSELVSHAIFSWQHALNAAANCKTIYGFSHVPESGSTIQLSNPDSGDGLAFTTVPIGSEVTRTGGTPAANGPPLVYAPVTASAITFGFNINLPSTNGFDATPIKLTPLLLAKVLTQSYRFDLPDFFPAGNASGPDWAQKNPLTIAQDPEFERLNPTVSDGGVATSLAPLLTEDRSQVNYQVWQWILSDPSARDWLSGKPDPNGMVVNPNYRALGLGAAPIDSYPRADPTCFNTKGVNEKDPGRCSVLLLPYVGSLGEGAANVRAASDPLGPGWDPTAAAPDGSTGWWTKATLEGPRTTFMWTVTDSANLASYGLVPADLCDPAGNNCVSPNTTSIATALSTAKPDSAGLVHVNPAAPGAGGYPLVDVTYAAVRTNQTPAALGDFAALIDFAAGPGQTQGVDPGQLPDGYLPLPESLRAQATAAAAALRADENPPPPAAPAAADAGSPAAATNPTGNTGTSNPNPATTPNTPTVGKPATSQQPLAALAVRYTPGSPLSMARWVFLGILIAGGIGTLGGILLRTNLLGRLRIRLRRQP